MNILLCHNYYQHPGGEDQTFVDEARLLEANGHRVERFTLHNDEIDAMPRMALARKTFWNSATYEQVRTLIQRTRPAVMHCTNVFPLISPSVYYAAHDEGVPVVQSLHNYRMMCANSLFLRDGAPCQDCLGKRVPWPAVVHGCYRQSRLASACVASMLSFHRWMRTWSQQVDLYCTPTAFAREKFVQAGLDPRRIVVKPNFVGEDLGIGSGADGTIVFAGRLSHEKGIDVLLRAWQRLEEPLRLTIIGDGPLADAVRAAAAADSRIQWLGHRSSREVSAVIGDAACVVLPSICYETFGRTVIESYCKGTPVIASNLGAIAELIRDGETGFLFDPHDIDAFLDRIRALFADPARQARMRRQARREYEQKYTPATNYQQLMEIYRRARAEPADGAPAFSEHAAKAETGRNLAPLADSNVV